MQSQFVELVVQFDCSLRVFHERCFGDLEFQRCWRYLMDSENRTYPVNKVDLLELFERQIYRDSSRRADAALPDSKVLAHFVEYPFADFDNQVRFLSERNEV